jgi:sulfate transport system permease protein
MIMPITLVCIEAFSQGVAPYWNAITSEDTISAIKLTTIAVIFAVIINGIFGIAAAWWITKYHFRGKGLLISLIELPFSISPVISGMLIILTAGSKSTLGTFLSQFGIQVVFTPIAIVIATLFVTLPFTARELISLMQAQGREEEEAAYLLGAPKYKIFTKIVLPNILPALLYGSLLTAARAIGEFGAVSVVSGHIRGYTATLPLQVEILYNDYQFTDAFAVSTLMMSIAILSVITRTVLNRRISNQTKPVSKES